MGVLNVTPDSFSDGGLFVEPADAVAHGLQLVAEGAAVVDVGGESTRPGAAPVTADEELARIEPVLDGLRGAPVSIDTSKAEVARRALELGAELVNDVTALRGDPALAEVVADGDAFLCLMHMQGEPRTMQVAPHYDDVVGEVLAFLEERVAFAVEHGIPEERICVDPGIGFGKNLAHNLSLLRSIGSFGDLGAPVLVGASRKRFVGELSGAEDPADRVEGSIAAAVWCASQGVDIVRVHDVGATVRALRVVDAVARERT
jgi:dihydropteroate synthase